MEDVHAGLGGVGHLRQPGPTATTARPARPAARRAAGSATTRSARTTSTTTSPGSPRRGAGQDGEIKPNISAPGVNVRSSVPGGSYGASAAPRWPRRTWPARSRCCGRPRRPCIGDIDATRALLDGTAIDSSSTSLRRHRRRQQRLRRGPAGRARAAQRRADRRHRHARPARSPTRPPATRSPAPTVPLDGATDRTSTTGADGTYSTLLPAGDYTGHRVGVRLRDRRPPTVTVADGDDLTLDFALDAAAMVTVGGHRHRRLRPRLAAVREGHHRGRGGPVRLHRPGQRPLQRRAAGRGDVHAERRAAVPGLPDA